MDQGDQGNEDSTISGFHKTGREGVRPEAYPILADEDIGSQKKTKAGQGI
jgi:hypothetical protein